jgi:hypothetical protein
MYGARSKLVCFSKPVKVTGGYKKTLAYYEFCPYSMTYKYVMFYSTGPSQSTISLPVAALQTFFEKADGC